MNTLLEMKNVTKYFGSGDTVSKALNGVSFTMGRGEFTAIMGASGSGKSTLLNVIATIDRPSSGSILLEGNDIAKMREQDLAAFRRDRIGFIFQEYNLLDTLTVGENIVLPLNLKKCSVRETKKRLKKAAASLKIEDQLSKFPRQLSGGQRQRAACARALITEPALILADEPTGNLDSKTSQDVLGLLKMTSVKFKQTIVMITHNEEIAQMADRIIRIEDGKVYGGGKANA